MQETAEHAHHAHEEQEQAVARRYPWLLPLASGIFLGAAAFDMVPQAVELAATSAWWWVVGGLVAFVLVRQGFDAIGKAGFAWVATLGIWIHSFLEGAVTASSYGVSLAVGLLVTAGLVLHLIPEVGAVIAVLTASGLTLRQALLRNAVTWGLLIAGLLVAAVLVPTLPEDVLGAALAFGAGGFLYVAFASWRERAWDVLPSVAVAVLGAALMAALGLLA